MKSPPHLHSLSTSSTSSIISTGLHTTLRINLCIEPSSLLSEIHRIQTSIFFVFRQAKIHRSLLKIQNSHSLHQSLASTASLTFRKCTPYQPSLRHPQSSSLSEQYKRPPFFCWTLDGLHHRLRSMALPVPRTNSFAIYSSKSSWSWYYLLVYIQDAAN